VIRYRAAWCRQAEASGLAARLSSKGHNMLKFVIFLQNFLSEPVRRDDRGATAIEYGLIVTLIAVVIIGVVTGIGIALNVKFSQVLASL
jgi:pilus assembly protein Flp/PilA